MNTDEILANIRENKNTREKAILYLYNNPQLKAGICKVLSVSEDTEQFRDVFNLSLVQFMKTVLKNRDFTVKSNLHSYLFVVARNVAYSKARKDKIKTSALEGRHQDIVDQDVSIDLKIIGKENKNLLQSLIDKMGRNCYNILWNWASGYSMNEIAALLDYSSEEVVRRKKYLCLKRLSTHLESAPNIKERVKEIYGRKN